MRLLLDTNITIPLLRSRSADLDRAVRDAITAADSTVQVSVASLWEIAIKTRVKKLVLDIALPALPDLVEGWGFHLLPIDQRHALAELDIDTPTRDPFDRLLLAQCQVEGLRLVTTDRALNRHPLAWRPA
jgi:PIN domain nuclease of toxin-antitoxin system